MEASGASRRARRERVRGRTGSRLAVVGIVAVLLALTGFALWAAATTNRAALHAARLSHLNDAYQRARFAVETEELQEHRYRLEPGPGVRASFQQAAQSLEAAVQYLQQHGDEADRRPIATLVADHQRYLETVRREFAAVDAGDQQRVRAIEDTEGARLFDRIEANVAHGANDERDETLAGLAALRRHVVTTTPIIFAAGLGLLVVFCGVLVGYQRRTERQALHDGLTGLPNRTLLRDRTGQAIRAADRELLPAALLLIDLDRFKEVNDTLGHHYGDQLLIHVGERLQGALREVDTVARLGGDEFAVLLPRIATGDGAVAVANKLRAVLEESFVLEGLTLDVEASVGLALYPDHGQDPDELLQHADIAMYVAKETHAGFVMFDPALDQHSPRVHSPGRADRAHRAAHLLRAGRGAAPVPPVAAGRPRADGGGQRVRASPARPHLPRRGRRPARPLEGARAAAGGGDHREHHHGRPRPALAILGQLNQMGVQLAIDDFGTGYSSMAYLKSLPVHELKVDRSFVSQMTSSTSDAVIVRSTVDLGRNLGLRVVAEGVEDAATWRELDALGCDAIQGYHVSRPVPPDDLITWLEQRATTRSRKPSGTRSRRSAGAVGRPQPQ